MLAFWECRIGQSDHKVVSCFLRGSTIGQPGLFNEDRIVDVGFQMQTLNSHSLTFGIARDVLFPAVQAPSRNWSGTEIWHLTFSLLSNSRRLKNESGVAA